MITLSNLLKKKQRKLEVLIVNMSTSKNIVTDFWTFFCLIASFAANYYFLGNSIVLQIVLGIAFYVVVSGRFSNDIERMSAKDGYEYLKEYLKNREAQENDRKTKT
jgi:hypothetical protein